MEALKRFMEKRGVSVEDLAKAIGVSTAYLQTIIDEENLLGVETACKIQKALGISAYNLLCKQLSKQIKACMEEVKVEKLDVPTHIFGNVDTRAYNALRRYECKHRCTITEEQLKDRDFLKTINALGPKSIEYILECPEKYRREKCPLAHV